MPDDNPILPTDGATWFAGLDDATKGYIENRGLTTKTAAEAFTATARAHLEAQAFVGTPAEQLLKLPKDAADVDGWRATWQRLGTPADAKDYDFAGVKQADGTDVTPTLVDAVRAAAFASNIPAPAAQALAAAFVKHLDGEAATRVAEQTAALETSRAALKANWGQNFDANTVIARQAAAALGVAPEALAALENVVGYDKTMELFRLVGTKIGEDKFVRAPGGGDAPMTTNAATDRLAELKTDREWVKRFLDGGTAENKEFKALNGIIYGQQAA